jgi:hypothetical protein
MDLLQPDLKSLVPKLSDQLLFLVDKMFDRVSYLKSKSIRTFVLDQEFIQIICDNNQEAVEEQKQHEISFSKFDLSRNTYKSDEFRQNLLIRRQLRQEGGNLWGGEPTTYLRRFHKMRLESDESRHQLVELQNKFNLQILALWDKEIEVYAKGLYQNFKADNYEAYEQLTRQLFDNHLLASGFGYDNRLSRKSMLVYSKPILDSWTLFLAVERKLLIEYKGNRLSVVSTNNSEGRLCRPLSPRFVMIFGVVNNKTRKALTFQNEQALLLKFDWFMPIRKAPLWSDYSSFYTLRELEALINIHFEFYHLIAEDYEQAVLEGLPRTT